MNSVYAVAVVLVQLFVFVYSVEVRRDEKVRKKQKRFSQTKKKNKSTTYYFCTNY